MTTALSSRLSSLDAYVFEVLMPDLVGHDRRPAAFVVYLYLLHSAQALGRDQVPASLQTIAVKTGLSKSAVQVALRHLKRRADRGGGGGYAGESGAAGVAALAASAGGRVTLTKVALVQPGNLAIIWGFAAMRKPIRRDG